MFRIVKKEELTEVTTLMEVEAPRVARSIKPGQFVIVQPKERGERIPLTMVEADPDRGTVTIVFQVVGKTTTELNTMVEGDHIAHFVGPLGLPTPIEKLGTVVMVGGGLGVAPIYPKVRAYKQAGNEVIAIIGARTKDLLILEKEMLDCCDELIVCTDDGSYGEKGFVTAPMERILKERKVDMVEIIGPVPLMKFGSQITKKYGVRTLVSLNPIMVDGTGMCGACRVTVGGETKFACVDGPDFDAHEVDFDELMARLKTYTDMEQLSLTLYMEKTGGACKWE